MSQVFVMVHEGVVIECISVNSIDDLVEIYPYCLIIEQVGEETVGWKYDGVSFTAPLGV